MTHTSIDAATCDRLRLWKGDLDKRYGSLERLLESGALVPDIVAFSRKSGTGRRRAFNKLVTAVAPTGAVLEGARMVGGFPLAVWVILKPRHAVVAAGNVSEAHDCVTVNYILAGEMHCGPTQGIGLWTLEVQEPALARLMQSAR